MVIRLKVKTLAILIVLLVMASVIAVVNLPSNLLRSGAYDAVIRYFPWSSEVPDALILAGQNAVPHLDESDELLYMMSDGDRASFSNSGITVENQEKAIQYYEQFLRDYPDDPRVNDFVLWQLTLLHRKKGDSARTEELLNQLLKQPTRAVEAQRLLYEVKRIQPEPGEHLAVKGSVRFNGEPRSGVVVFLKSRSTMGGFSSNEIYQSDSITVMTDKDGNYSFYDVPPGEYLVGVAVPYPSVEGYFLLPHKEKFVVVESSKTKDYDVDFIPLMELVSPMDNEMIQGSTIQFEWKPVKGAQYYQVSLTSLERSREDGRIVGSLTRPLTEKWMGTSASYNIEALQTQYTGSSKSHAAGDDKNKAALDPNSILGLLYPGGEFSWSVDAYGTKGEKIGSSSGYYRLDSAIPFFTINAAGESEGDRYARQYDYEKAIQAYEQEIPDPKAVRKLALIYDYGITWEDHGNPHKALPYWEMLQNPTVMDQLMMADDHQKTGEPKKAIAMYEKLAEQGESRAEEKLGDDYRKRGMRNEAMQMYKRMLQHAPEPTGEKLVLMHLLDGDIDEARKVAEEAPIDYAKENLHALMMKVEKKDVSNTHFMQGLEGIELGKSSQVDQAVAALKQDAPNLATILKVLRYYVK
jgi:tetratricopeptide (TPR) repeat protein